MRKDGVEIEAQYLTSVEAAIFMRMEDAVALPILM